MLGWLAEYGMFFAKVFTVVVGLIICFASIVAVGASKKESPQKGRVAIKSINDYFEELKEALHDQLMDKVELKAYKKEKEKQAKEQKKQAKANKKSSSEAASKPRLFVIDFDGDMKASEAEPLAKEINSILTVAKANDEVMLRLESPGGVVHGYGLAASQLKRLRDNNIKLTVCVDKVAASGGYMMACVADHIVAAPFSIIGSIGVVAQLPNFNKLLKKHDIDYDIYTAGAYKRTVTMLGENTEEGKKKLNDDLQATHDLFKNMIQENRPNLDVPAVATGEIWYGTQAIDKQLVDAIGTSDDFIISKLDDFKIYQLEFVKKKSLSDKLGFGAANILNRLMLNTQKELTGLSK